MRIAIFSDTFFPQLNGVTTTVYQSAKSLVKLGHEVMIFTVARDAEKYIDLLPLLSISTYDRNEIN